MSSVDSTPANLSMSPAALESSLNELSETKRFRMLVCHENSELRIFIEGAALPEKQKWVRKVGRLLSQVELKTTLPIYIYGRQIGDILPQWQQRLASSQVASASQQSRSPGTSTTQAQSSASPEANPESSTEYRGENLERPQNPKSRNSRSQNSRSNASKSQLLVSRGNSVPAAVKWGAIAGGGIVLLFFAALGVRSLLSSPSSSPDTPRPQEYALQFDGEDDIAIASQGYLPAFTSADGGFSVSAWVYPTRMNTYSRIVERSDNTQNDRLLFVIDHEERGIRLSLNGNYAIGSGLPLNEWSHVAGTYDGVYIRVYINSELKAETPYQGVVDLTTSELWIGNNRENSRPFAGSLKDIQLWQRALTDGEIQQAMQQTPPADTPDLLLFWEFSEASRSPLTDQVRGIPLTLQVAPDPFSSTDGPRVVEAP